MAKIIIVKTGNAVLLTFNDEDQFATPRRSLRVNNIVDIIENGHVEIELVTGELIMLTGIQANTDKDIGIVDTVSGNTTDDNTKLFTELDAIIR